MADSRFDTSKDPRFKRAPKHVRRVEVDERFAHMFNDKNFVEAPKVDSRGQRVKSGSEQTKLREFYELAEGSEQTKPRAKGLSRKALAQKEQEPEEDEADEVEADDDDDGEEAADAPADDEDETDDEEEEEEDSEDEDLAASAAWEQQDAEVPRGDASKRLVLMGCDWDRVSAADLLVMMRTYLKSKGRRNAANGSVDKVSVYPSDYGLQKLQEEASEGPSLGAAAPEAADAGDDENGDEASKAQAEALRLYQLQRTKYCYAVADCDSPSTAAWLYDQLDGMEADGLCPGMLDLRFAPDDLEFPHAPTNVATEDPKKYQAPLLTEKGALGHTKVQCTWDDAPVKRKRDLMKKRFTPEEMREADLQAYLASTTEEEDDSGAKALRSLVRGEGDDDDFFADAGKSDDDEEQGGEVMGNMEATFSTSSIRLEDELTEKVKKQGQAGKKVHTLEAGEDEPKTVWEKYLQKRKEKRKDRRAKAKAERDARKKGVAGDAAEEDDEEAAEDAAGEKELELLALGEKDDGDDRGFNFRGKKRGDGGRAKATGVGADENFKVNLEDPRISKVFSSADFEIDPTNPEFRASDGMKAVLKKKRARKQKMENLSSTMTASATSTPATNGNTSAAAGAVAGRQAQVGESTQASTPLSSGGLQLFGSRKRPAPAQTQGAKETAVGGAGGAGRPFANGGGREGGGKRRKKKTMLPI